MTCDILGLGSAKPVIGVIHLRPLPTAPRFDGYTDLIVEQALADARALEQGGVNAVLIENFGDTPFFPDNVPQETIAWMTRIGTEIRAVTALPLGVCVLRNDARAALSIAHAIGGQFIRVCILGAPRVTDQGLISGAAFDLLRARANLRADVQIWADVDIKHSYSMGNGYDLKRDAADLVSRSHADALIVTGSATGQSIQESHLQSLWGQLGVPVLVGSGVTEATVVDLVPVSDGFIVGTSFKQGKGADAIISADKARTLCSAVRAALHETA